MQEYRLRFHVDDADLARLLANSEPPDGVTARLSPVGIEAGTGSGVFVELTLTCNLTVPLTLLVGWLVVKLSQSKKKTGRVNGEQVEFKAADVMRLLEKYAAQNHAENKERNGNDDANG